MTSIVHPRCAIEPLTLRPQFAVVGFDCTLSGVIPALLRDFRLSLQIFGYFQPAALLDPWLLTRNVFIDYSQRGVIYASKQWMAFSGQILFSGSNNPEGIPNALIDFAEGRSSGALRFVGDSHRNFRTTSFGFFGEDSFKLRKNLTLNYGLRYELNTVLREAPWPAQHFPSAK